MHASDHNAVKHPINRETDKKQRPLSCVGGGSESVHTPTLSSLNKSGSGKSLWEMSQYAKLDSVTVCRGIGSAWGGPRTFI